MATARADVAALLGSSASTQKPAQSTTQPASTPVVSTGSVKAGDVVKIASGATYYNGKSIPSWVQAKNWVVHSVSGDRVVVNKSEDGRNAIMSPINAKFLSVVGEPAKSETAATPFESYRVKITTGDLNIRKGAGTNYAIAGAIRDRGVYTIVAESDGTGATKWGKLKSGAGWISLDYTKRI